MEFIPSNNNLLEAVPIAEVCRLVSKGFDCRRKKRRNTVCISGLWAKADGKFAVKMRVAIGTASEQKRSEAALRLPRSLFV